MKNRLSSKRALVVGASRGIGTAVAKRYATEGASVALAARSVDDLHDVASDLETDHAVAECDLRDSGSVEAAVGTAVEAFGGLDVVFNSAGLLNREPLLDASYDDVEAVIDTNLMGAIRLSKAVLPALVESSGSLVHVSSDAGERGLPSLPAYCASKAGVNNLVRQLAVEYGPEGVSVTAIAPGTTKTSMNEQVRHEDPTWVDERAKDIPLGRLGTPEDVSTLAVFLAADESDYITGEVVNVDGGTTA